MIESFHYRERGRARPLERPVTARTQKVPVSSSQKACTIFYRKKRSSILPIEVQDLGFANDSKRPLGRGYASNRLDRKVAGLALLGRAVNRVRPSPEPKCWG